MLKHERETSILSEMVNSITSVEVNVHDCPDPQLGKAIPYGIYDIGRNEGWVSVGQDHDTASFAVASLRRWWQVVGYPSYPQAKQLLISADSAECVNKNETE